MKLKSSQKVFENYKSDFPENTIGHPTSLELMKR